MYDSDGHLIFYKPFISQNYISQLYSLLFYKLSLNKRKKCSNMYNKSLCFMNLSEPASIAIFMRVFAKS